MGDFVKLPFETAPLIQSYQYEIFFMGIIQGHCALETITPWLCSRYLNCAFGGPSHKEAFFLHTADQWGEKDGLLWRANLDILQRPDGMPREDILGLVRLMLKNGHYVGGCYNEKYIPGKRAYGGWDFMHDFVLYGYDDRRQVFFSVGYMKDSRCRAFEIPYEDFYRSIVQGISGKYQFSFFLYNESADYSLRPERIVSELWDYLHSTSKWGAKLSDRVYGLESVRRLKMLFAERVEAPDGPYVDVRFTRALMEHKFMLHFCMAHLAGLGYVEESLVGFLKENYDKACLIHNLGLKINISRRREGVYRMATMMDAMMEQEARGLPFVLEAVQGKM